jgi:hypothetical protein
VIATAVAATLAASEGAPGDDPTPDPGDPGPGEPSTLKITFVKDGDVWFWEEGTGPASQLTALGDVVSVYLSDDGLIAAFIRQHDWYSEEIYAVNTDGTNIRPLVSLTDLAGMVLHDQAISAVPNRIDWRPGTHILAFNTRMTFEGPGLIRPDELRLVDADSGAISVLMPPGTAGDFFYSPDGNQIALSKHDLISVVDADGTNRHDLLTFPTVITYSEYLYYPPVRWAPDSSYLRAAIPAADPLASPPDPTVIWHLPADGSPASTLTSVASVPFFQDAIHISLDSNKIAFLTGVSPGAPLVLDLHIANADGSGDLVYTSGDVRFHDWTPSGEHFIYSENGTNPQVGRIGYPPLSLSAVSFINNVSWVDETRYLYLDKPGANWDLWLGELGASAVLLASTTGDNLPYDFVY